jgi:thiamine biosynthesis lipoprotein
LDLGGIAAGFIVDRAFAILQSHGLKSCLINAGGDIRCGDPPPGREGWRIEVASPQRGGPGWRRIHLANAAITTSGDLWQYSQVDGKRRSHILNPKDGYGVEGPLSITVIASHCLDADAAATALCVMGAEAGYRWIQQHADDYQGLWLQSAIDDQTHLVWISDRFPPPLDQP